jgi:hypothetical protein
MDTDRDLDWRDFVSRAEAAGLAPHGAFPTAHTSSAPSTLAASAGVGSKDQRPAQDREDVLVDLAVVGLPDKVPR